MGFEIFKETYTGTIKEISIGRGNRSITIGGETCYPFYLFEGSMPHRPKIAMEVWDMIPEDWPDWVMKHFRDVAGDPVAWAQMCTQVCRADMVVIQLKSTDPNGRDASPESAAETVGRLCRAVDVPIVVWGTANAEKDDAVLKAVAEACRGENLILGPVEDKNYKGIGAAALAYDHIVAASSPIDVNLAKQLNILLENLGMPTDRIIMDPTTGGLGYGMEYTYSVMERIRMAGLVQGDTKLQYPMINNLAEEVWKCKEARETVEEAPLLGIPEQRGILMEAVGAVTYLMAGSDILIMRHPEAVRLVRSFINSFSDDGDGAAVPFETGEELEFSPEGADAQMADKNTVLDTGGQAQPKGQMDKILRRLDKIHRRGR